MNLDFICFIRFQNLKEMRDTVNKIAEDYEGEIEHRVAYNFPLIYAKNT